MKSEEVKPICLSNKCVKTWQKINSHCEYADFDTM